MQTFLPYSSYFLSAECLDNKRLGKQRVEAKQILNILLHRVNPGRNGKIGWKNHPAVKMWHGYENSLMDYMNCVIQEWINRGFKNNMEFEYPKNGQIILPHWIGQGEFHLSHRANLLRKYPEYYKQFGWSVRADIPYIWPNS